MSGCENFPRGFAQVQDYDTFLIYHFFLKIRFS